MYKTMMRNNELVRACKQQLDLSASRSINVTVDFHIKCLKYTRVLGLHYCEKKQKNDIALSTDLIHYFNATNLQLVPRATLLNGAHSK